jgi:L-aspartate oxidase
VSQEFDILVVGSGIAGLSFALKVAQGGANVAILTKKNQAESNTNYAQGGIAAVTSASDDLEAHVTDTLQAGDGLCDENVVREIIHDGPACIQELIDLGVDFTRLGDGRQSLGREGGHSKRRILHVKDMTGKAIEEALLAAIADHPRIIVYEHFFAIDFLTVKKLWKRGLLPGEEADRIIGLYALNVHTGEVETFSAHAVMLASGGVGQVYQYTTNPSIATGDGIAMAYRCGLEIHNLEFVQFHPTALYSQTGERFLITEALRGEGARLRNLAGEAFMEKYDDRTDLAPRDIVARAIDQEMKKSGARHVWLDATDIAASELQDRFPNIYSVCLRNGIDITKDPIPVVPAAHYLCGGVASDTSARTALPGFYVCGEVACTGLHGANRLASNSLLEAVVMAHRGALAVLEYLEKRNPNHISLPLWVENDLQDSDERVILLHNQDELKRTLWDYVGIVRSTKRLKRARTRIRNLQSEIQEYYWNFKVDSTLLELRNMILVASLIVECALQRKESRGLHYTLDYPQQLLAPIDSCVRK